MHADSADDLVLVQRVTTGDEAALETLYARYMEPLFAFIYHQLGGTRQEAEEVWQDTLLASLEALPGYRGQSQLFTWLCGIARHKIADFCRRSSRSGVFLARLSSQERAALIDAGPLPEEILLQKTVRAAVSEALGALPEEYRRVLVARYAEERGVDEIARSLGKTYKATESLLSRARAAFRESLVQVVEGTHDE